MEEQRLDARVTTSDLLRRGAREVLRGDSKMLVM
jgi:hypothetical protein